MMVGFYVLGALECPGSAIYIFLITVVMRSCKIVHSKLRAGIFSGKILRDWKRYNVE